MKKSKTHLFRHFLVLAFIMVSTINVYSQNTIFTTQVPMNSGNDSDYELGTKFSSSQSAEVTAIRFYKMTGETGIHTGRLWTSTGTLLASILFTGETSLGWQTAQLSSPVIIEANTTYVVSVNSNSVYPIEQNALASSVTNGFLSTIADGNNGVYNETIGLFPTSSYNNSNYFVDVVATPLNSIFTTQLPVGEFNDGPYEMGVKFTTSQYAKVKYIRYYKMPGETGSHTGRLWSIGGAQLASVSFQNETSSGWQYAKLSANVYLSANISYVVSVNSNSAYGAGAAQSLQSSVVNGILSTIADNNNAVYGTPAQFPTSSFNNNNYFRDIIVTPIVPPAIPTLISPNNLSTGNSIEPVLSWSAVSGADSYSLQVATDASFTNLILDQHNILTNSYSLSGLTNQQIYYWKVSAEKEIASSGYSAPFSFTTIANAAVIPNWPIGGVYVYTATPTVSWSIPMGGIGWKFDLLYSTNFNFTTPTIVSNLSTMTYQLTNLLPGTTYYWKVRLKTSAGAVVSYSAVASFISYGRALVPNLSWPIGNTVTNTLSPTLYWYLSEVPYQLTFDIELVQGATSALTGNATSTGIGTQFFSLANLQPDKQYSWQVRSKSSSQYSDWSIPGTFKTYAVGVAVIPTPSWPIGGTTVYTTSPSLNWYLGTDGTGLTYQVEYVEGLATNFTSSPNITNITSLSTNLTALTPGSDYKWRVRSFNGSVYSDWSTVATFKVVAAVSAVPVVPIPSWPIGGATVYSSSTQLNWYLGTSSTGLTFEVEYGTGSLTGSANITGITNLNVQITNLQAGQTYNWRVRSKLGAAYSAWSAIQTFVTINNAVTATTPIPSWPIGGTTVYSNSPTLSWFLISGSTGLTYTLQYATNAGMNTPTTIAGITVKQYVLSGLTSGASYYWRVRSFDGLVYSSYSSVASFVTSAGNAAVVPVAGAPLGDIMIQATNAELSWFIPTIGEIKAYQVEYSKDDDMSNATMIETDSPSIVLNELKNGGEYYWRVRSKNVEGNISEFSPIEKFRVGSVTGVENIENIPTSFDLKQNYPNPFNPETVISWQIAVGSYVTLKVYDILGKEVTTLVDEFKAPGNYNSQFAIFNLPAGRQGYQLSSGVYFYQLQVYTPGRAGNFISTKKMLLLR